MENKPKQTAVDYLFLRMEVLRHLFLFEKIDYKEYVDEKKDAFEKAKEMEKQQMIDAWMNGAYSIYTESAEKYYKQEYGSKKSDKCCTPPGQIKRYIDCIGCDKNPKNNIK